MSFKNDHPNPLHSSILPDGPIGVFDSGLGGLWVLSRLALRLPHESFIFFADSSSCPYGSRTRASVLELSRRNVDFLLERGAKAIVIACNTATAASVRRLRKEYAVPIIGMEPAVKKASAETRTGKIGVLATAGTFEGEHYRETSRKYAAHHSLITRIGEGLVELVEQNQVDTEKARKLIAEYVRPMLDAQVDQIVLGCTHYPFFTEHIRSMAGPGITIQDPSDAVSRRTEEVLRSHGLLRTETTPGRLQFFTSGESGPLVSMASCLFSGPIQADSVFLPPASPCSDSDHSAAR